ncbi:MAG: diguanylate cyclase domain-containing protein [Oceanicaulis sp.]
MGRSFSIIVVDDCADAAEAAARKLRALGFKAEGCDPATLTTVSRRGPVDAVVAYAEIPPQEDALVMAVGESGPQYADIRLRADAHAIQIAARLRAAIRLSVLDSTAAVRVQDAAAAGSAYTPAAPREEQASILFVGAPCPAFMRLQHAMAGANTEVIAAFSTFNAFDYLHERAFDAVVLNTEPTPDLAHTVCSAMRRNTRLYHTPALLLVRGDAYGGADEAFARGASDLLNADAGAQEMRDRVTALASERRRRRAAKAMLEGCRTPALLDEDSDLFNAAFGERHLASLLAEGRARGHALSVIGLKLSAPHEAGAAKTRAALKQFAGMLRHCVRAEDLAARAGHDAFYLALPSTRADEARMVAARVSAIAECTAYEGADPHRPFRLSLATRVIEPGEGWSASDAVSAALAPAGPRPVAAVG